MDVQINLKRKGVERRRHREIVKVMEEKDRRRTTKSMSVSNYTTFGR